MSLGQSGLRVRFEIEDLEFLGYAKDLTSSGLTLTAPRVFGKGVLVTGSDLALTSPPEPVVEQVAHRAEEALESLAKRLVPVDIRWVTRVVIGRPAGEIVRVAGDEKADLIVMGTLGLTGLQHLLVGSVTEKVVRTAPCPVLTVRRGVA